MNCGRLLINFLGKLRLRPVLGNAGVLDGDGDLVRNSLVLDLLILIWKIISISDHRCVMLNGSLVLASLRSAHDGTGLEVATLEPTTIVISVIVVVAGLLGLLLLGCGDFCPLHLKLIKYYR